MAFQSRLEVITNPDGEQRLANIEPQSDEHTKALADACSQAFKGVADSEDIE